MTKTKHFTSLFLLLIAALFTAYVFTTGCTNTSPVKPPVVDTVKQGVDTVRWSCTKAPRIETTDRSVVVNGKPWPNGKVMRIKLMGGTAQQIALCHAVTDTISKTANVTYDYSVRADNIYDYRVQLNQNGASWSYIGQDCNYAPQTSPTCTIGWMAFDATLHEFTHGLGWAHEQANPYTSICWNKAVVYEELARTNGWSKSTVDYNVFYTYPANGVIASAFDPVSIMQYVIKGSWTCDGIGISGGHQYSVQDRRSLAAIYPGRVTPPIVNPPNPTTFTLTLEQRRALLVRADGVKNAAQVNLAAATAAKVAADSNYENLKQALGL